MLFLSMAIFAQKGKVNSALSYKESGDLGKAYDVITVALDSTNPKSEKSITWPKAWLVQGEILHEIHRKDLKGIVEQPLFKAYDSYIKAIEFDEEGKHAKSIADNLHLLQKDLYAYAIHAFDENKFAIAQECLEKYTLITNTSIINTTGVEIIDTAILYNTGIVAYQAANWNDAIKYFRKTAAIGYKSGESYCHIFNSFYQAGDTLSGYEALKEGMNTAPDNECLLVGLINYYINNNNLDEAIKQIDHAIKKSPLNVSLYSNAGVIYYNRGVNKINEANLLPPNDNKAYDAAIELGKNDFKLALPYLEKAHDLDGKNIAIMESLKSIYYRFKSESVEMSDKFDDIVNKIEACKQ